jgi:hypothetical protein
MHLDRDPSPLLPQITGNNIRIQDPGRVQMAADPLSKPFQTTESLLLPAHDIIQFADPISLPINSGYGHLTFMG